MSIKHQTSKQKFAYISHNFINLYTEDNPILNIGDESYFLFTNLLNINRPMIARGVIVNEKFGDGYHKHYFFLIKEILEPEHIQKEFIFSPQAWFETYTYGGPKSEVSTKILLRQFKKPSEAMEHAIMVENMFCRQNLKELLELRNEYIEVIKNDLQIQIKQITEMEESPYFNDILEKSK